MENIWASERSARRQTIRAQLELLAEPAYARFQSTLLRKPGETVLTGSAARLLGVRLPALRKLAARLAREDWAGNLEALEEGNRPDGESSYEEILLQGLLIGCGRAGLEEQLERVKRFVALIDNWAICDSFCAGWKAAARYPREIWDFLQPYLVSPKEYDMRFALVMLLDYFVTQDFLDRLFPVFDRVRPEGYYGKMALAWAVSVCYVRFPQETQAYLERCSLDAFTYRKALQKIAESRRISEEDRQKIRRMKKEETGAQSLERRFLSYAGRYDRTCGRVELKIVHTLAVVKVMEELTAALGLGPRLSHLARVCAMYHDIGRFEQLKRYGTFLDHCSVDHAALGCGIIEQEGLLEELSCRERRMVLTAIANHNRIRIPEGLEGDTLLLCKLIRDADKCDIFRVFACEDMVDTMGETEETVAGERVSDGMFQSILAHRCVKKEERKTGLDIWVSFLSFFFDLNFKESVALAQRQKYYRQPFDRVRFRDPETERRIGVILSEIETYLARRLEGEGI